MTTAVAHSEPASTYLHSRVSSSSSLALPPHIFRSAPQAEPSIKSQRKLFAAFSFKPPPKFTAMDVKSLSSEKVGYTVVHPAPTSHEPISAVSVPDPLVTFSAPSLEIPKPIEVEETSRAAPTSKVTKSKPTFIRRITSKLKQQPSSQPVIHSSPPAPVPGRDFRSQREAALRQCGLRPPAKDASHQERETDNYMPISVPPLQPQGTDGLSAADQIKREWEAKNQMKSSPSPHELEKMRSFRFGGSSEALVSASKSTPELMSSKFELLVVQQSGDDALLPPPRITDHHGSTRSRRSLQSKPPPLDLSASSNLRRRSPMPPPESPLPPTPHNIPLPLSPTVSAPISPSSLASQPPKPLPSLPAAPYTSTNLEPHLIPLPPSPHGSSSPPLTSSQLPVETTRSSRLDVVPPETRSLVAPSLIPSLSSSQTISTASSAQTPSVQAAEFDSTIIPTIVESPLEDSHEGISTPLIEIEEAPEIKANLTASKQQQSQATERRRPRRDTDTVLSQERRKSNRQSVILSLGAFRRSIVGSLNSRTKTRTLSPSPDAGHRSSFDASHLPPSPSLPSTFTSTIQPPPSPTYLKSPSSQTFRGRTQTKKSPPPPVRKPLSPTVHSRASIAFELETMSGEGDEESRRLSEMAFLG